MTTTNDARDIEEAVATCREWIEGPYSLRYGPVRKALQHVLEELRRESNARRILAAENDRLRQLRWDLMDEIDALKMKKPP